MNKHVKDAIFGLIGGAAGTLVIGQAMGAFSKLQSERDKNREKTLIRENPTERAQRISEQALGVHPSPQTKAAMGHAIHWGYGIFWGGVYGLLRDEFPAISWAAGLPFGVSLAIFGGGLMLPLMQLTPPAHRFPVSSHVRDIVSHYAYAATVECVCGFLENVERTMTKAPMRTKPELRIAT